MEGNNSSNEGVVGLCPLMMLPLVTSSTLHHHHHNHQQQQQHHSFAHANNSHHHQHQDHQNPSRPSNITTASSSFFLDHHENYNLMDQNTHNNSGSSSSNLSSSSVKAKIMAHPHYHRLLTAYLNCQKVGAPAEVVTRLEEACGSATVGAAVTGCLGEDPGLDQFMEAYCEMLTKYEQELSKPFKEAMVFLQRVESQFKALSLSSSSSVSGDAIQRNGSSTEEDVDVNNGFIDAEADDRELKGQLLRRYSGYLGSLKQEFMKKRKKGKLPKEARQQLLDWWSRHYKWPYPSESQKLALAEGTGLDQKQINNWFINQRKRHWKPSEDMQFVVMDSTHPHYNYMDTVMGNPYPMDISPTLL